MLHVHINLIFTHYNVENNIMLYASSMHQYYIYLDSGVHI